LEVGADISAGLFWLGVIEANRPELSPRFFQSDLACPIPKISVSRSKWVLSESMEER
jgi:hypothetical protein